METEYRCERCGSFMTLLHCELVCPKCGMKIDCED